MGRRPRVAFAATTLAVALLAVSATAPGQVVEVDSAPDAAFGGPPPGPLPRAGGGVVRLGVETTGTSALLARWSATVRSDFGLVDEVTLVRRRPDATLHAAIELAGGERTLVVTLRSGEETVLEHRVALPPLDARASTADLAVRRAAHGSADRALEALTGRAGSFDSTLVYARRAARRRKDVWRADADGHAPQRVSSGRVSAMLPTIAHGDVWYSVVDPRGLFLTRAGIGEEPVLEADGLTMGVQPCGERIVFSSTRDGDAEIYSATPEGHDVRRLTYHPGIDVSPTCGPTGDLAFISNRTGTPQIHVLPPGELHPERIEQPDGENQTPTWCADPERRLLAFTHVERGMHVWMLDADGDARRLSPTGRRFKDPAFSPDCRLVAYVGPDGIWISSLDGRRRRRVISGATETVRWAARTP